MNLKNQRRMSKKLLKIGKERVWMDPEKTTEINEAITREDIRNLIVEGSIKVKPVQGISRFRARSRRVRKRGRKPGSIKGKKYSVISRKRRWINKIRPLRRILKKLKEENKIDSRNYRRLYLLAKGNFFRDSGHLRIHLERQGVKV